MTAPRFLRALLAAVTALGLAACDRRAGTSDEHETTVAARLYQPDGSPASGARIKIYAVADTSKTPQDQVFTAADGSVNLPTDLPAGEYNLVVSDGDGNGLVIDSLRSKGTGAPSMRSDTLRPMGVLRGRLQVEPQHSPRIAWVQILGTGLAANVDTLGNFRLEVPAGRITLVARTLEPQYTPTFRAIRTIPDSILDIGVVRLEYTGIPVVEGLSVTYDTLNGVATVRWNRATMPGLLGYVLYGTSGGAITIDDLGDTSFSDALFHPDRFVEAPVSREYSVVGMDSARDLGTPWRRVSVAGIPPWSMVRKGFRHDTLGRMPPSGCDELDTLAGGLVCTEDRSMHALGSFGLVTPEDSTIVHFSRDGIDWEELPIPLKSLRTVAWKGKIWVLRGIASGGTSTFKNSMSSFWGAPDSVTAPLYDGVVIESWSTSGVLERSDSLLDRKDARLYRLMVVSDTLVLSRDSGHYGQSIMSPVGLGPTSLGLRRLANPDGAWSGETLGAAPKEAVVLLRLLYQDFGGNYVDPYTSAGNAILEWQGLQWTHGNGLFGRRAGEAFPWKVTDGDQYEWRHRYRGNGEVVPPFVVWKGCALQWENQGRLLGICPED